MLLLIYLAYVPTSNEHYRCVQIDYGIVQYWFSFFQLP